MGPGLQHTGSFSSARSKTLAALPAPGTRSLRAYLIVQLPLVKEDRPVLALARDRPYSTYFISLETRGMGAASAGPGSPGPSCSALTPGPGRETSRPRLAARQRGIFGYASVSARAAPGALCPGGYSEAPVGQDCVEARRRCRSRHRLANGLRKAPLDLDRDAQS